MQLSHSISRFKTQAPPAGSAPHADPDGRKMMNASVARPSRTWPIVAWHWASMPMKDFPRSLLNGTSRKLRPTRGSPLARLHDTRARLSFQGRTSAPAAARLHARPSAKIARDLPVPRHRFRPGPPAAAASGGSPRRHTGQAPSTPKRPSSLARSANFPVTESLVEEKLKIAREFFVALSIETANVPSCLSRSTGGSGIEGARRPGQRVVCDVATARRAAIGPLTRRSDSMPPPRGPIADALQAYLHRRRNQRSPLGRGQRSSSPTTEGAGS